MRFIFSTICLLCLVTNPSIATTYLLNPEGSGDFALIQDAIDAAVAGDVIELTDGTYLGHGNVGINFLGKPITLRSQSGDPTACILRCNVWVSAGITFNSGETHNTVLAGITIRNGPEHNIYCEGGSPRIENCYIVGSTSEVGMMANHSDALISNCTFYDNGGGDEGGGGLQCSSSTLEITDCKFDRNETPEHGGGIRILYGSVSLRRCVISNNRSEGPGAGIYQEGGEVEICRCLIVGNETATMMALDPGAGGGIFMRSGRMALINSTVANNASGDEVLGSSGKGGGIYLQNSAELAAFNTDILNNSAYTEGNDGYIVSGLAELNCCLVDLDQWAGPGTPIVTFDGCPPIAVDTATWGSVKAMYR